MIVVEVGKGEREKAAERGGRGAGREANLEAV